MASLFRHGLIYGFRNINSKWPHNPLTAKRHLVLNFADDDAEARYRAHFKARLGNEQGSVPREFVERNLHAIQEPWWVEFVGCNNHDKTFRVAMLGNVERVGDQIQVVSSLWTDVSGRNFVGSSLVSRFTLGFSDDGYLLIEPDECKVDLPDDSRLQETEPVASSFLTTVDSVLAICAFNEGWFQTERAGHNEFTFSEARKAKAADGFIARKKALLALDVREVKAYIDAPPVPEWQEFDPLAEKAFKRHHGGVREHEVRSFTRFYKKSGKVVSVRAHRRGNPDLGSLIRMTRVEA